jgi:hypothetical protein
MFGAGRHSRYALVAPPLIMDFRSDDGRSFTMAGPFYLRRTPSQTTAALLPLAYYKKAGPALRLTAFPLFHYSEAPGERTVLAPLVYHDEGPRSRRTFVYPLYWDSDDPEGHSRVAFPFYWDFENHLTGSRFLLALPLFARYRKGESETNVLGNVVWTRGRTRRGRSWSFHFFPALSLESDGDDHFKWRALLGLVGRERSGDWHRWQVFWYWLDPSR